MKYIKLYENYNDDKNYESGFKGKVIKYFGKDGKKLLSEINFDQKLSFDDIYNIMKTANKILHGYGIEAIHDEDIFVSKYYQDIVAEYINMGDSYVPTLLYDTREGKFDIISYGDFVEALIAEIEEEKRRTQEENED